MKLRSRQSAVHKNASRPNKVCKARPRSSIRAKAKSDETKALNRSSEASYLKKYRYVIGVDEAGRGPLAGPVVTAACIIDSASTLLTGASIMDSKATTEPIREAAYEVLTSCDGVYYSVCRVEHDEIDRLNILQATMSAMSRAVADLLQRHAFVDPADCIVLVDGNRLPPGLPTAAAEYVVKGDSKIYSIAAASILAKITRDRIMDDLHEQYPKYNLAKHKGYPTLEHRTLLSQHGPSAIHRYSYRPVADAAVKHNIPFSVPEKAETTISVKKRIGAVFETTDRISIMKTKRNVNGKKSRC